MDDKIIDPINMLVISVNDFRMLKKNMGLLWLIVSTFSFEIFHSFTVPSLPAVNSFPSLSNTLLIPDMWFVLPFSFPRMYPTLLRGASILKTKKMQRSANQKTIEILDPLLGIEEKIIEEGEEDGYEEGRRIGNTEGFFQRILILMAKKRNGGYELGVQRGREIGEEVGYYQGCLKQLPENLKINSR
jgi:hypothetical protein